MNFKMKTHAKFTKRNTQKVVKNILNYLNSQNNKNIPNISELFKDFSTQTFVHLTPLKVLHHISHLALKKRGWEWEWRRQGDESIGLWRFKINTYEGILQTKIPHPRRWVIIPGFGDNALSWIPFAELLSRHVNKKAKKSSLDSFEIDEIVILDWPGVPGHLNHYRFFQSLEGLLQATTHILQSLQPSYLMGHSMGGWLAASYGANYLEENTADSTNRQNSLSKNSISHNIEKLIIISPSGIFESKEELKKFEEHFLSATENGFNSIRKSVFKYEPFWFRFFVHEFDKMYQKDELKKFIKSAEEKHFLDHQLQNIKVPTYLIWGDEDELCLTRWRKIWLDKINPKYLKSAPLLKKTGHTVHLERPIKTYRAILKCLDSRY